MSYLTAANAVLGLAVVVGVVCLLARRNNSTERPLACWGTIALCAVSLALVALGLA